jgi:hypothetical protein
VLAEAAAVEPGDGGAGNPVLGQERIQAEQRRHQQRPAIMALKIGGMHRRMHQEAMRVHEGMALPAFDLLAAIKAGSINRRPSF